MNPGPYRRFRHNRRSPVVVLALALAAAPAFAQDSAEIWFPLSVGSRWEYSGSGAGSLRVGEQERFTETAEQVTVSVDRLLEDDPRVRVVQRQIRSPVSDGSDVDALRIQHLAYDQGALRLHGSGAVQQGLVVSVDDFQVNDPPALLLPAALAVGTRWDVLRRTGELNAQGAVGELAERAQVRGFETVTTPAGRFENCLVVVSSSSGSADLAEQPGARMRVSATRTSWYARGVGLVKLEAQQERQIHRADGVEVIVRTSATELLQRYALGPAPASPQGADASSLPARAVNDAPLVRSFAQGNPVALERDERGVLLVLDSAAGTITRYGDEGQPLATFTPSGAGRLRAPRGLSSAQRGGLYVADTGNHRVAVFRADGSFERAIGRQGTQLREFSGPEGVLALDDATLLVADTGNDRLQILDLTHPANDAALAIPEPIAVKQLARRIWVLSRSAGALALPGAALGAEELRRAQTEPLTAVLALPATAALAAPVDFASGHRSVALADGGAQRLLLLRDDLSYRRALPLAAPPLAVALGRERTRDTVLVANGARIDEFEIPIPSPIPVLERLRERLAAGDTDGALALIHPAQRGLYRKRYAQLGATLPAEAAAMASFELDLLRDGEAQASIERAGGGSFLVRFLRSPDGGWLILSY